MHYLQLTEEFQFDFFAIYGQTEATRRMSFVPPVFGLAKLGSASKVIPGGELLIDPFEEHSSIREIISRARIFVWHVPPISMLCRMVTNFKGFYEHVTLATWMPTGTCSFKEDLEKK